jgi:Holliday junction resolvase RusA-like endonuclease
MFDPGKSKDYKRYVSMIAAQHRPPQLIESAVGLSVKVYRPIPGSWSKVKQEKAEKGEILPTSKPDLSNYIKGVEDAIEGILLKNDSQVVDYQGSGKWYSHTPRIEVAITELF